MTKAHNDIQITCRHGVEGGPDDFVQLFRYMESQAKWVPVNRRTSETVMLDGTRVVDPSELLTGSFAPLSLRYREKVRCRKVINGNECNNLAVATEDRLHAALLILDAVGQRSVPIEVLRAAIARTPSRRPRHA